MTGREIAQACAHAYGLTLADLRSSRRGTVALARQATVWVLRQRTGLSLAQLGEVVNKEHSSISDALKRAKELRGKCPTFRAKTDALLTVGPVVRTPRHPAVLTHRVKPKNEHVDGDSDARMRMHGTMALERALRAAREVAA